MHEWLADLVPALEGQLNGPEYQIDARYGLIGFGQTDSSFQPRWGHSQLVNPDTNLSSLERFFGSGSELEVAFADLGEEGGREDGWDAIDHAVAEYDFRAGAVPMLFWRRIKRDDWI